MTDYIPRPATPQAMVHRLPDKLDISSAESTKPLKFIILIVASNAVAGKVQIARSVSNALACPLFQGDSLHETAAKAASVGTSKRLTEGHGDEENESRPAGSGFTGFGGTSSTSASRRGSTSSNASDVSSSDAAGSTSSVTSSVMSYSTPKYINKPPVVTRSTDESLRGPNPALMVVTHPELETWHKGCIRNAVGDYGIGVIFVPLDEDEELPILKPLDPRTMTKFGSLRTSSSARRAIAPTWDEEVVLRVNLEAKVEDLAKEIVHGVQDIMND